MPWSRPSAFSRSSRSSLDAVASTVAPARLASWIAAMPTPPAPAWIEHGLARLQVAELEQAVVRGAERDRHARGRDDVRAVGDRPRRRPRARRAARRASPTASWRRPAGRPRGPRRPRRPRGSCPRTGSRRRAGVVAISPPARFERVAALDADRLDLDEDARRRGTRGRGRPRSGRPRARRSRNDRCLHPRHSLAYDIALSQAAWDVEESDGRVRHRRRVRSSLCAHPARAGEVGTTRSAGIDDAAAVVPVPAGAFTGRGCIARRSRTSRRRRPRRGCASACRR